MHETIREIRIVTVKGTGTAIESHGIEKGIGIEIVMHVTGNVKEIAVTTVETVDMMTGTEVADDRRQRTTSMKCRGPERRHARLVKHPIAYNVSLKSQVRHTIRR